MWGPPISDSGRWERAERASGAETGPAGPKARDAGKLVGEKKR
jgi:hypothetical protein